MLVLLTLVCAVSISSSVGGKFADFDGSSVEGVTLSKHTRDTAQMVDVGALPAHGCTIDNS